MKRYYSFDDTSFANRRAITALEYALMSCALFGAVFLGLLELSDILTTGFSNIGNSLSVATAS